MVAVVARVAEFLLVEMTCIALILYSMLKGNVCVCGGGGGGGDGRGARGGIKSQESKKKNIKL